ncbi:MAG: hypothetical protein IT440_00130 [Phycisphaeraceae bacterium]|nr:hypothetical protein [Phycisphaeraceae bacterium]
MSIPVTCVCGRKFNVKPELRGKRVRCPACGNALRIPGASDDSMAATLEMPASRISPATPPSAEPPTPLFQMPSRDAAPAQMTTCRGCGASVPREDVACPHCGANVETGIHIASTAHLLPRRRRRMILPTWMLALGGLLRDILTFITPRGISPTLSGGVAMIFMLGLFGLGLAIWSNTENGRISYLNNILPDKLTDELVRRGVQRDHIEGLTAISLTSPRLVTDPKITTRFKFDAKLSLVVEGQTYVLGQVHGDYNPGLLILSRPLTDNPVHLTFDLKPEFYERLNIPAPKSR